eukprot:15528-Heterococcus_DN1.PRE.2
MSKRTSQTRDYLYLSFINTVQNNRKLDLHKIRGMPVCTADNTVLGLIDKDIVRKAQDMDQGQNKCKGWMLQFAAKADVNQTISEIEDMLVLNDAGRLPVLEDGKLVGLITRTDLLRHHNFYDSVTSLTKLLTLEWCRYFTELAQRMYLTALLSRAFDMQAL